jgi:hypothetical protein
VTAIARLSVSGTGGGGFGRALEATGKFIVTPTNGSNAQFTNGSTAMATTNGTGSYSLAIAGAAAYKNGSAFGTAISTASYSTTPAYIGNNSGLNRNLGGAVLAVAFYNIVLTATQVAAVSTAMADL